MIYCALNTNLPTTLEYYHNCVLASPSPDLLTATILYFSSLPLGCSTKVASLITAVAISDSFWEISAYYSSSGHAPLLSVISGQTSFFYSNRHERKLYKRFYSGLKTFVKTKPKIEPCRFQTVYICLRILNLS